MSTPKPISEVELCLHYMRQSKMDNVRRELESIAKAARKGSQRHLALLEEIKILFKSASNNAPMP